MGKKKSKTTLPTEDMEASASESLLPGKNPLYLLFQTIPCTPPPLYPGLLLT